MVTSAVLKLSSVESGRLHVIQQINAFTRTLRTARIYSTHISTRLLGLGGNSVGGHRHQRIRYRKLWVKQTYAQREKIMRSKPFLFPFLSSVLVMQANCTVMEPLVNFRMHTDYVLWPNWKWSFLSGSYRARQFALGKQDIFYLLSS